MVILSRKKYPMQSLARTAGDRLENIEDICAFIQYIHYTLIRIICVSVIVNIVCLHRTQWFIRE